MTVEPVRPGGSRHPVARLAPVRLAASAQVRLRRLVPGATYREELAQLLVPLTGRSRPPTCCAGCSKTSSPDG